MSGANMDPLSDTLREITGALNRLGIRYAVGGSLASSARSIWRSTMDVDLVAAFLPAHAEAFVQSLGKDWYADPDTIRDAVKAGRSFNVIHLKNVQKVDVFPAREQFHRAQLDRATVLPLGEGRIPCAVTTAEDILLAKLRWFLDGGRVSERQWNDILGLIAVHTAMDWTYVDGWAATLGVSDLLRKAREEASEPGAP